MWQNMGAGQPESLVHTTPFVPRSTSEMVTMVELWSLVQVPMALQYGSDAHCELFIQSV